MPYLDRLLDVLERELVAAVDDVAVAVPRGSGFPSDTQLWTEGDIETAWAASVSGAIWRRLTLEEQQDAGSIVKWDSTNRAAGIRENGHSYIQGAVAEGDTKRLEGIAKEVFRLRKGEDVHFPDGCKRLSVFMTKRHFFELARKATHEHKVGAGQPYKFAELCVWMSELNDPQGDIDCTLRVIRQASNAVGAKFAAEFELVMSGLSTRPQMWHMDGVYANLAGVVVLTAGARGPTQLLNYPHRWLCEMTIRECKKHVAGVFKQIIRTSGRTKREFDEMKEQESLYEELSPWATATQHEHQVGGLSAFLTDHLHRGAGARATAYSCFFEWQVPEFEGEHASTDGEPVHLTNFTACYRRV